MSGLELYMIHCDRFRDAEFTVWATDKDDAIQKFRQTYKLPDDVGVYAAYTGQVSGLTKEEEDDLEAAIRNIARLIELEKWNDNP